MKSVLCGRISFSSMVMAAASQLKFWIFLKYIIIPTKNESILIKYTMNEPFLFE